jgi:hypothetical protein
LRRSVHHLVQTKRTCLRDAVTSQSQELRVVAANTTTLPMTTPPPPGRHWWRRCFREDDDDDDGCDCAMTTTRVAAHAKLRAVVTKVAGADIAPPPAMSWTESFVTLVGAGSTLYTVTLVSRHLEESYGDGYRIVLGYVYYMCDMFMGVLGSRYGLSHHCYIYCY